MGEVLVPLEHETRGLLIVRGPHSPVEGVAMFLICLCMSRRPKEGELGLV
jgi:hypothetical protein